jgi:hypothetical protein
MWPVYLIYVVYMLALLAAVATVPLARRGKRRLLWIGWGTLAVVLPTAATLSVIQLVPPSLWPVWRFAVGYILLLAAPTGVTALVADQLSRRQPMPKITRHSALVGCAFTAAVAASVVVSRPLTPDFSLIHAEL